MMLMDEKELGNEEEIKYEVELETPIVSEPSVAYQVDEEAEYKKYLNLPEMTRAEFTGGKIYYLAAANDRHQELLLRLGLRFGIYLHGKQCKMRWAPSDVKIDYEFDQFSRETLQPDLYVFCDETKLSKQGLNGTPDLVIEILSPSDPGRDKVFKFNKYLKVGVREYWIVDPIREEVMVNILYGRRYDSIIYRKGDVIKPTILDHLFINVTDLFEGYQGREIEEVEVAREEERADVEVEKWAMIERFLNMGLSDSDVAQGAGVDLKLVIKIREKIKKNQLED